MNLRDYLHYKNITLKELAEELMISPNHLGAIKRGEANASKQLAKMIQMVTKGEVDTKGLLDQKKTNKKKKKNGP